MFSVMSFQKKPYHLRKNQHDLFGKTYNSFAEVSMVLPREWLVYHYYYGYTPILTISLKTPQGLLWHLCKDNFNFSSGEPIKSQVYFLIYHKGIMAVKSKNNWVSCSKRPGIINVFALILAASATFLIIVYVHL